MAKKKISDKTTVTHTTRPSGFTGLDHSIGLVLNDIKKGHYNNPVSERYNSFGLGLIRNWRFKDAECIFRALLEKEGDKNRGRNLNNLGLALRYQDKFPEAIKMFEEAYRWDKEKVGDEKAKTLPAFRNLQFTKTVPKKIISQKILITKEGKVGIKRGRNGGALPLDGIGDIFHKEVLAGGILGGLLLIILQDTFLLAGSNIFLRMGVSLLLLAAVLALIIFLTIWKNSKSY